MTSLLHINDNNLVIWQGGELGRSQGYAWLKDGTVYFDFEDTNNAVAACRLEPQQINNRYWQQCEQTAIAANDAGMRHAADLVWRHLGELKSRYALNEVTLVVPSHYQTGNLQLLLGIAKACDLTITGLVNKAVLCVAEQNPAADRVVHIDIQLHQTVCSSVEKHERSWRLGGVEILHEVGLHAMQDALLKAAQERFIQSDRFDPLHYAETEQQLFDQLPRLAVDIDSLGKANMLVVQGRNQHGCSIDARQWQAALDPLLEQLRDAYSDQKPQLRLYDFNGFEASRFADDERKTVDTMADGQTILANAPLLNAEGDVTYLTELDATDTFESHEAASDPTSSSPARIEPETAASSTGEGSEQIAAPAAGSQSAGHATHLLQAGIAVPIGRAQISMANGSISVAAGSSNIADSLNSGKLFVVGAEDRRELRVNDRLASNLADGVLTVIRVE